MSKIKKELSLSGKDKISDFPKTFNKLLEVVERLVNTVSFLFALVITLLVKIFFFNEIAQIFNVFNIKWGQLSEGYQLLFLGVPLAIIAHILGHIIIKKYIDPLIKKKDDRSLE